MAEYASRLEREPLHSHRVSWGAVTAGVLLAIMTQILLGLLGLAIGLSVYNPGEGAPQGIGVGSGIWLALSTIISVFIGAWGTSWWANDPFRKDGILHGVLTWSLFMVVTMALIGMGIGTLFGGAVNILSSSITGAATRPVGVEMTAERIQDRLGLMRLESTPVAENLSNTVTTTPEVRRRVAERIAAGDNAGASRILQENTGLTAAQANQVVAEARTEAPQEAAAGTVTKTAWWTFVTALLSLIAAAIGGRIGCKNPYMARPVVP